MLFTTATFAFVYLPIVAIVFFALGRRPRAAAGWLGLASVFFYGYWMPVHVVLLLISILCNFGVGSAIGRLRDAPADHRRRWAKPVFVLGLAFNLGLLAYYKYANFLLDSLRAATHLDLPMAQVILPIGISFFTFTQIAFLADTYQKGTREYRFIHYLLFVTYFPHLVAGPVLHHAQMMPQFASPGIYRPNVAWISAGLALFALGLVKKVIFADGVAPYADALFDAAAASAEPTFREAWIGAFAYTFQLYFDFSGYSDMAVGLSMVFGIKLPYNFNSPYKATNISDFWRRWHMSLSAFLRDYLYVPLGGNRRGPARRHFNLMVTMLLGGLWHGASWTFVAWGGLHGLYLVVHHFIKDRLLGVVVGRGYKLAIGFTGWLATFLATVIAWVFFRAESFTSAGVVLRAMASLREAAILPDDRILFNAGLDADRGLLTITLLAAVALLAPNTNRLFERHLALSERSWRWAWLTLGVSASCVVACVSVNELRESVSPFIYFNF